MKLRMGTRASKMALHQANLVRKLLMAEFSNYEIELVSIHSDADHPSNQKVFDGKGVFIKKLDEALLRHDIDFAVNCMKDIPNDHQRHAALGIAAVLPREDVRDALLLRAGCALTEAAHCTLTIGTSAPRRRALVRKLYPRAQLKELRGSCDTRVNKLDAGEVDALILSKAGLERINLAHRIHSVYEPEIFLPPLGAGVITLDTLKENQFVIDILRRINHPPTYHEMLLERAFLNVIQGDCHTPMGGYIHYENQQLHVQGTVFSPDGVQAYSARLVATFDENPQSIGMRLAEDILAKMAK